MSIDITRERVAVWTLPIPNVLDPIKGRGRQMTSPSGRRSALGRRDASSSSSSEDSLLNDPGPRYRTRLNEDKGSKTPVRRRAFTSPDTDTRRRSDNRRSRPHSPLKISYTSKGPLATGLMSLADNQGSPLSSISGDKPSSPFLAKEGNTSSFLARGGNSLTEPKECPELPTTNYGDYLSEEGVEFRAKDLAIKDPLPEVNGSPWTNVQDNVDKEKEAWDHWNKEQKGSAPDMTVTTVMNNASHAIE